MSSVGEWRPLRVAIVLVVGLAAGVVTFLQFGVWAMATSHPGLAGEVMVRQRLVATLCSGAAVLVVATSAFRRRLPIRRLVLLLAFACASLACGVVLVWRDSQQWDGTSSALTGLTLALLMASVGFAVAAAKPRV
jgi:hypothetical protein